jgi:predicted phosphoadenosine phosphosulfate sulfurtransferase
MDKQASFETHVALIMKQDLISKKDAKWLAWVEGESGYWKRRFPAAENAAAGAKDAAWAAYDAYQEELNKNK